MIDSSTHDSETVIQIDGVTRRFGSTTALDDVSLSVPRGTVFGLVGVNGAGKTTLLKHVLGLLKAQTGRVRVFGLDPVADPVGVLSRIGYLSEELLFFEIGVSEIVVIVVFIPDIVAVPAGQVVAIFPVGCSTGLCFYQGEQIASLDRCIGFDSGSGKDGRGDFHGVDQFFELGRSARTGWMPEKKRYIHGPRVEVFCRLADYSVCIVGKVRSMVTGEKYQSIL